MERSMVIIGAGIAGRVVYHAREYDEAGHAKEPARAVRLLYGGPVDDTVLRHRVGGAFRQTAHPIVVQAKR